MTITYQLIKDQTLSLDYNNKEEYTDTYYALDQCNNIVHTDGETLTKLSGNAVIYKEGLIKVYSGADMIARLLEE